MYLPRDLMRISVVPSVVCCKDRSKKKRSCFPSAYGVREWWMHPWCCRMRQAGMGHRGRGQERWLWGAENTHMQQDASCSAEPCPAWVVLGKRKCNFFMLLWGEVWNTVNGKTIKQTSAQEWPVPQQAGWVSGWSKPGEGRGQFCERRSRRGQVYRAALQGRSFT